MEEKPKVLSEESAKISTTNESDQKNKTLFFVLFFILGLTNNLGSLIILSGSNLLASRFGYADFMAFYPMAVILFSSTSRFINSRYFITVAYEKRIFFLSFYIFTAYALLSLVLALHTYHILGDDAAFFLTLIPGLIMGTGYAFGESTLLGFLRLFPKNLVGGWTSGTGLAGLTGGFISIVGKHIDEKLWIMYLGISPVAFIYFFSFKLLNKKYEEGLSSELSAPLFESNSTNSAIKEDVPAQATNEEAVEVRKSEISSSSKQSDVSQNLPITVENLKKAWGQGKRYILNLALVYLVEFTASNGVGQRISFRHPLRFPDFFLRIKYESMNFCYQIGVFISRSCLPLVRKITFVETFVICQSSIGAYLVVYYYTMFCPFLLFILPFFIVLGFFGGGAYAAIFYFILNDPTIDKPLTELVVNISTICNDIGVFGSSVTTLIFHRLIMPHPDY